MSAVDYTGDYDPDADFDRVYTLATARRVRRWLRPGDRVLELGAATGLMTAELAGEGRAIEAVDRSAPYLERLRARGLPGVTAREGDVEAVDVPGPFEHVLATNLLHELGDPSAFLAACRERLAAGGLLHVSLPNPRSLHRIMAVELGMLGSLHDLSTRGERYGTRRLLDAEEVVGLARGAGLECAHREGVLVKPFDNARMASLPPELLEGLDRLARHLPEHGAMNLFAFTRG